MGKETLSGRMGFTGTIKIFQARALSFPESRTNMQVDFVNSGASRTKLKSIIITGE